MVANIYAATIPLAPANPDPVAEWPEILFAPLLATNLQKALLLEKYQL
jgi:hypothetical protein